jgi:branched-chain amino acid transport system permease protein
MEYFISLAVLIGIYITLSSSFNLIIGFGGLVSIAHPIFFALGAIPLACWPFIFNCILCWLLWPGAALHSCPP